MSEFDTQTGISASTRKKIKWGVAALLLLLAATVVMNLPRGFSDDLSQIGQGRTAVVLVRDNNAVQSMQLMNTVDSIRSRYHGRVLFLLTDYDTAKGRAFMAATKSAGTTLVLFDPSGKEVKVLSDPQTAASIEKEIATITGASV